MWTKLTGLTVGFAVNRAEEVCGGLCPYMVCWEILLIDLNHPYALKHPDNFRVGKELFLCHNTRKERKTDF